MDILQFNQTIDELFGKDLLAQFDDDYGFMYEAKKPIYRIGFSTNLSLEVIEQAVQNHVDLLLTHHDAWDFIYGLRDACTKKLEEYGLSHFYIHAPLDYVDFGTCTSLMNILGISLLRHSYYENGDVPGIGELKTPLSFSELKERMSSQLKEPVRAWQNHSNKVKKVGVLTGAGHSTDYIKHAIGAGCDTYITGEATLYSIQYAQFTGINLLAGSHTFTEIFGVENLANRIKEKHPEIEIIKLEEEHFELGHV